MMEERLSAGGATLLILSCSFVLSLLIFCYHRVLKTPDVDEHMHGPIDIDTHDQDT